MFDEMFTEAVGWDDEIQRMVDQHGLLKELAQGGCHVGENKFMLKAPVALNRVVQEVPSQVVWDEELLQTPDSEEDLLLLLSEPATIAEHVEFRDHDTSGGDAQEVFATIHSDREATSLTDEGAFYSCKVSESAIVEVLNIMPLPNVIWDEEPQHGPKSEGLLLQLASGEAMLHNANSHAGLLQKLASGSNGNDLDTPNELLQQLVWDEMPASIGTHDGLLQYSAQSGNYFDDEEKVESMDPVRSRGASHVMFHAMTCTDVVWNDDLLHGHEYLEQAESKTTAMSRIYARQCLKEESTDELHIRVVWDSKMQSDMEKYEGMLQQLSLSVDIEKGPEVFMTSDFSPRERVRQQNICLPTILKLEENLKSAVLVQIQNYVLYPSLCLRKCSGVQNSIFQSFGSFGRAYLFSLQIHYCDLHYGEMQKPIAEDFLGGVLTDVSSSSLCVGSSKPQLACGKTYLDDEKNELTVWLGDDKVLILIGDSSRSPKIGMVDVFSGGRPIASVWTEHILNDPVTHLLQQHVIGRTETDIENAKKLMVKLIEDEMLPVVGIFQLLQDQMLEHIQLQLVDFKAQVLFECDSHKHVTQFGEYLVDGDSKPEAFMDQEHITTDRDTPFLLDLCMYPVDVLQVEEYVDFGMVLCSAGGDDRPPWWQSAFSLGNDYPNAAPSVCHQIPSWNPNDFSSWSSAWSSIVGLQKFQHVDHSDHQITAVSKYDIERILWSRCLNVPWDPGGNHKSFIPAIAWGQAMFCGGGIVTPDTIPYMGPVVRDSRLCYFGRPAPSIRYKGKEEKIERGRQYFRNSNRGLEGDFLLVPRSPPPIHLL